MQLQLMRYSAERYRINKSGYISNIFAIEGNLLTDTDVLRPVITIEKSNNPIDTNYNYMYIPAFKRYYFASIENNHEKLWTIKGEVDALYSFMPDIIRNQAIIDKSEGKNNANMYLNDGSYVMDSRKYNYVYKFPSGLSEQGQNILIVAGGGGANA